MVYGGLRYGGRQHLGRYLYQCAGNGAEDGYDLYPDLLRLYLRLCGGGVHPVARVLPLEHDHHLLLLATTVGKQGAQNGRELLPVVEDGAAVRFYVVCILLHRFVVTPLWPGFTSFVVTVLVMTALIWLYTRRGGIKTLVWTDTFQTTCMFTALLLIIWQVMGNLEMNVGEAVQAIAGDTHSRMFVMDDWLSRQNFWKQFLSGVFIVIVMTGLDQDMMQKNL